MEFACDQFKVILLVVAEVAFEVLGPISWAELPLIQVKILLVPGFPGSKFCLETAQFRSAWSLFAVAGVVDRCEARCSSRHPCSIRIAVPAPNNP